MFKFTLVLIEIITSQVEKVHHLLPGTLVASLVWINLVWPAGLDLSLII